MGTTSVSVTDDTWKELNRRKERGQTFDDVITTLIERETECDHGE